MNITTIQPVGTKHYVTALPPEAEKKRRQEAIINDPIFKERIGSNTYEISSDSFSIFWITTEDCTFRVDIETIVQKHICGPGTLVLHFGEVILKEGIEQE